MTAVTGTDAVPDVLNGDTRISRPVVGRRSWLPGAAAVLIGTVLICAHAALYGRWLVDDAAITFDYARNIVNGYGPVFQPGMTPVEGYSNPSWLVLLVMGHWIGLFDRGSLFGVPDYVVYTKGLAVIFCAGTLVAFQVIAARLVRRPWLVTLGAGVLLACIPSYVAWCFSGLENSLYAFVVTVIAAVTVRAIKDDGLCGVGPALSTGLLAFVAAMTRPDGMIYAAAFPLVALLLITRASLRRALRAAVVSIVAFAVPFVSFLLWRHAEFGQWVSNTAKAKSQQLAPNAQTISAFNKIGDLATYVGVIGVLVALLIVGLALGRPSSLRQRMVGVLVPLGLAITAFGVLNPDWMDQYRFATPIWALGALVVTVCTYRLVATAGLRTRAVVGVGIVVSLLTSLTLLKQHESDFRASPTVPMCLVATTGGQMINSVADAAGLPDSATYLGPDMGGSSLILRVRAIDLVGLTDARIAEYRSAGDMRGLADYIFGDLRPDIIQAMDSWRLTGLDPRLNTDYDFVSANDPRRGGVYLRKSVVSGPAVLTREHAIVARWQSLVDRYTRAPRSSCGDPLTRGETLSG